MKIKWLKDTTLNIVVSCDDEVVDDYDIEAKMGTIDEVDIVEENETHAWLQFGDGSVAFGVFKGDYTEIE